MNKKEEKKVPMDSEEYSTDEGKRKRDEAWVSTDPFAKSMKIAKSPVKSYGNKNDMNELKEILRVLTTEVRAIRDSQKNYEEEIKGLKEENTQMKTKIKTLENKVEMIDKKYRKNNIVIKGVKLEEGREKQGLENFIQDKLNIEVKISSVQKIPTKIGIGSTVVVTVGS